MKLIELRTVMVIMFVTCGLCTLLLTILWRQNRNRFEGTHLWAIAFALQTLGVLLILLREVAGDWLSIVASNLLIISAAVLQNAGLERFWGKKSAPIQDVILLAVFTAVCAFFTYGHPSVSARIALLSAGLLIVFSKGAWLLLRRVDPVFRDIAQGAGWVMAGFAGLSLIRLGKVLISPDAGPGFYDMGLFQTLLLIVYVMLLILQTYSLSLMINKQLVFRLQNEENKFSKVFYTAPYGLVILRRDGGEILEVNDVFLRMTGYPREEIVEKSESDIHLLYSEEDAVAMLDGPGRGNPLRDREMLLRKKNGDVFCILASSDVLVIDRVQCLILCMVDITERKRQQFEREALIEQLERALSEVSTLSGLLPICSSCKKIRDDKGYWNSIEAYIHKHSAAKLTHGICPECRKKLYPDYAAGKVDKAI